jgi:hypothetical protein
MDKTVSHILVGLLGVGAGVATGLSAAPAAPVMEGEFNVLVQTVSKDDAPLVKKEYAGIPIKTVEDMFGHLVIFAMKKDWNLVGAAGARVREQMTPVR